MITGVVLARNEEKNILACLEHLRPHVEEIILIDMESADRTMELAQPLVDQVLPHPLLVHFDSARNIAIPKAKCDWLWFCDADERIPIHVGRLVRELVANRGHEFEALSIPFKTYFCGKWIEHCGWWPGYTMPRVLKRGHFRFRETLHGGVEVAGREVRLAADERHGIDHYSYESVEHYYEKFNRYTTGEAQTLAAKEATWDWRQATQAMMRDLWLYYERNAGHADGAHGWILSWLSGQYRWASQAKLIDIGKQRPNSLANGSHPANLDEFFEEAQRELARLREGTPRLPLNILWCSPIDDPSGYADDGRTLAKALAAGERELAVEPIEWSDRPCPIPEDDRMLFVALKRTKRPRHFAAITNCIPSLAAPTPGAVVNILRTTFETDRIPSDWHAHLDRFNEIWILSEWNRNAFIRSGVAPEKLRIVPPCVDTRWFQPDGPKLSLPLASENVGRFIFLSVFDWQLRKGWDVLLRAYAQEFSRDDGAMLLLKISRVHGHPQEVVRRQANEILAACGTSLEERTDIVFWEAMLDTESFAALYRRANAFVLTSRGEGWGRPLMEAMACGLPVIGTNGSGNVDFMTDENSLLIPAQEVEVSEAAAREIPVFRGHRWFEPDEKAVRGQMRTLYEDEQLRARLGARAAESIRGRFALEQGRKGAEQALAEAERKLVPLPLVEPTADALRVELQGELLANHSFSNINEALTHEFADDPQIAWRLRRRPSLVRGGPGDYRWAKIAPFIDRELPGEAEVTIRHAYPPDWSPVECGKWVHIQPWEFGYLPSDWIEPLRERVDEIWAPSHYVKRVYEQSGIPSRKVHVIPWGIDPLMFHTDAPPRHLPIKKTFRFLYVGGTIYRKGFDLALDAYLREFTPEDDVCLVIKDLGHQSVYRYGNFRERVIREAQNPNNPQILYLDEEMTPGQLASLYTACQCFVAPYRGEGFGMPILEAMACGLAPIVPRGGPTDDFVDETCGYLLDSREIPSEHPDTLCGPAMELAIEPSELRQTMREAYANREKTRELGMAGAAQARSNFTWKHTADAMKQRMMALVGRSKLQAFFTTNGCAAANGSASGGHTVSAIVTAAHADADLADCLARLAPFTRQVIVLDASEDERTAQIAREYDAEWLAHPADDMGTLTAIKKPEILPRITSNYFFLIPQAIRLHERDWAAIHGALESHPESDLEIPLRCGEKIVLERRSAPQESAAPSSNGSPAIAYFRERFYPHLLHRAETFRFMLEYLERLPHPSKFVVETGCVRMPDDWTAGQSTLIFDSFTGRNGGRFVSIDLDPKHCALARGYCQSAMTTIVNDDSLRALQDLAKNHRGQVDLLYLDSLDVDWRNPHPSALHHLKELCAAMPLLKPGALVVVDDHRSDDGLPGKSLYVAEYMKNLGIRPIFERYQVGWVIP